MKRASKEINVFSISALDLFASALGAFMIVSFVLFPYFPNTSRTSPMPTPIEPAPESPVGISPAEVEALREQVTRAEAELLAARSREQELAQALQEAAEEVRPPDPQPQVDISPAELAALQERMARAEGELDAARARERGLARALDDATSSVQRLPPLDLVIALDTTSSMRNEVASLREEIAELAELLVRLAKDVAIGVIDFKDRCDPATALRVAPLRRIDRESVHQLAAFARSMRPGSSRCNTSASEDYATALRAAVSANWRPGTERRSIVMVSDNPAHDDMRHQAVADARQFAQRTGARHIVSTVLVDSAAGSPSRPDAASFMQSVAEAGGGQFVRSDEDASLSVTILRAIFDD